jgi:hypothetical protein
MLQEAKMIISMQKGSFNKSFMLEIDSKTERFFVL